MSKYYENDPIQLYLFDFPTYNKELILTFLEKYDSNQKYQKSILARKTYMQILNCKALPYGNHTIETCLEEMKS